MKKKICGLLIALCLLSVNVNQVYASAGTIVVGGSSIGVAGIGAAGLAGLSGPVVIGVFCGLMALGLNVELTKASEQAGMTKTQFVKTKIQEYCNEANITLGVFCDAILSGMTILNDGRIALSNQACSQVKQFGNWLFDNDQVNENTPSQGDGSTVNLGNLNLPISNQVIVKMNGNNLFGVSVLDGKTAACYIYYEIRGSSSLNIGCGLISNQPFDYVNLNSSYRRTAVLRNGYYIASGSGTVVDSSNTITYIPENCVENSLSLNDFVDSLDGSFDMSVDTPADDSFTGDRDDWASGSGVLDPTADKTTTIDPGLLGQLSLPQDTSIEWDWQKYLDAIQDLIDKAKDDTSDTTADATDQATGLPITITINPTVVIDPTIAKENDSSLPPQIPAIDKDEPASDPDISMEPLKFDLRNIFPFCLPWDFKDMLSKLNAEPVAPSYHVHWRVPFVNEYIDFTVDLSGWNDTAAILRKMELFAFCVGLALATRQIFIRS